MANKKRAELCVKGYGEHFKALREKAGLTQQELGKELHYSDKTISSIESEKRQPTNEQLLSYKTYFDVTFDYLLGISNVQRKELRLEDAYQRGYKDGYEIATKKVITALMEAENDNDCKEL